MSEYSPMTADSVQELLTAAGAEVMTRSGRSEHYSAPRDFSFEVKAVFPNGMGLYVVARQFNYRDPWEGKGRVNDLVDVSLLRDGGYSFLPKGYPFYQDTDLEERVDSVLFASIVASVSSLNPKIYELQQLTGSLPS
jgi:hypothetical protein